MPERRKQPKRIQTLPPAAAGAVSAVFSYVEPEHCRCECHAHPRDDDQLPLLQDDLQPQRQRYLRCFVFYQMLLYAPSRPHRF